MKKTNKFIMFTIILLVLLPTAFASTLDVKVTDTKEIALEIKSDKIGWQDSRFEIFTQKGKLVYEFESQIYYSTEPVFELLKCPDCKSGNYNMVVTLEDEVLKESFSIKKEPYDWFWMITLVLVLGLFILAKKTIVDEPILVKKASKSTEKKPIKKSSKKKK